MARRNHAIGIERSSDRRDDEMARTMIAPALALGVALAAGGTAVADDTPAKSGVGAFTMTLGGQGTAAQAATQDTELTHGWHHGGGWHGGYGGWGGYRGGWGGYYGGYRGYY